MKLGLLADIHEEVTYLRHALAQFQRAGVEQVVVLGDVYCMGRQLHETAFLLTEARAVGVWGNHDIGLCFDPEPSIREKYGGPVLDFMGTLKPRLEIDGCLFTHVEPWLDANDPAQLWYFEGIPETAEQAGRSFRACGHHRIFVGHYHRWIVTTPTNYTSWSGYRPPLPLDPHDRYLVVVHAVAEGKCAVYDTVTDELVPYDFSSLPGP